LLLTYPLRDGVVVAAKFAACAVVLATLLAGTLLYPYVLQGANEISWAPLACGYLGLLLLGVSFIACGMFVSSLTDSQVVAAIVTLGILLLSWMVTWNEAATNVLVLRALAPFAMFDHFERFARGVIDAGDLVYFVSFSTFFTFLTLRVLEARQWRGPR
jgi:ABC-2 type transport system permease protein